MTLQEIIKKFKKKSWLRLCTLYNHNKWELISLVNESVFPSKYFIDDRYAVTTTVCNLCGENLDLGIYHSSFIAIKTCKCGNDGTHNLSFNKLRCMLSEEQCFLAINMVNNARKTGLSNTIEYWTNKGYTLNEAKEKVIEIQTLRSAKSPASKKGARGYSIRTVEYWTNKGYTLNEAKEQIKKSQITNGLEYYKFRYGEFGEEMFNARIKQWLNADGNKQMIQKRSRISLELFEQLDVGYYGINEKTVRGKQKVHRVDFLHGKKIIEFYGDYWHGNPTLYDSDAMVRKKKVADIWDHDAKKIEDLTNNGYEVLIIWESEYKNNPAATLQKCEEFIR